MMPMKKVLSNIMQHINFVSKNAHVGELIVGQSYILENLHALYFGMEGLVNMRICYVLVLI